MTPMICANRGDSFQRQQRTIMTKIDTLPAVPSLLPRRTFLAGAGATAAAAMLPGTARAELSLDHAVELRPDAADHQQGRLHQVDGGEPRRGPESAQHALGPLRLLQGEPR